MKYSQTREITLTLNEDELNVMMAALNCVKRGTPYHGGELRPEFPNHLVDQAATLFNELLEAHVKDND
jgi:hypothetical protein